MSDPSPVSPRDPACQRRSGKVGLRIDGVVEVHLPDTTCGYATLCGVDGDDPSLGQFPEDIPADALVTCERCAAIWTLCQRYKAADFNRARVR